MRDALRFRWDVGTIFSVGGSFNGRAIVVEQGDVIVMRDAVGAWAGTAA